MANFKTHLGTSTLLGVGYGALGASCGVPLSSAMLASGLCSVSGMLPDLDSDSGRPVRESFAFAAAVVPMLMVDRFQHMGLSNESMVLAGGLIYVAIRFGASEIFRRYTVHRGMWHSLPAAVTVGMLAFLICSCSDTSVRLYKSGAVVLGFLSHLALDELYSVRVSLGGVRVKKSFGTAIKMWSRRSLWANISTYGKLLIVSALVLGDPVMMRQFDQHPPQIQHEAQRVTHQWWDNVVSYGQRLWR